MPLRDDIVEAYAMHRGRIEGVGTESMLAALRRQLAEGSLLMEDVFVALEPRDGSIRGSWRLAPIGEGTLVLTQWRSEGPPLEQDLDGALEEACTRAAARGATRIVTRVEATALSPAYREALRRHGFRRVGGRVEYRTAVDELPPEAPSAVRWRPMEGTGEEAVYRTLDAAGSEGPDALDRGADGALIEELLGGPYREADPRSVQLGFLEGDPVCVLIVRVEPESGWSSIAFMGVIPAHRGRGLGVATQLHGFAVIRALGGRLYHDGTSDDNAPMLRLFERHGCIEHERMEEWEKRLS
jgi:GNAT superfamily N-acetyltransferase